MTVGEVLREDVRNTLLRRVDWRFLLGNPQPAKSICFARGLLSQAVELISGSAVDGRTESPTDCDLAVALNPDHTTLRAAWGNLRPGGSCYTEWYSPLVGGAKGVRRRLETAGFNDVRCYWCWPWPVFSRARYWLPLEAPGAVRYFRHNRLPSRGLIRRLISAILRSLWHLCFRVGLILPVCAVARKPATDAGGHERSSRPMSFLTNSEPLDASGTAPDLLSLIRIQWERWGLGATPDTLSSLVLTGGPRSISKVVALVFADANDRPGLVVKMTRVPEGAAGLVNEATALRAVHLLRHGGVSGAPRILFCCRRHGLLAVGETALVGRPLSTLVRRSNFRDVALTATDWLCGLVAQPTPVPRDTWWDRLVEPVLANFDESFGAAVDTGMFRETSNMISTLDAVPLVCEQRDFAPWNTMLTSNGALAVLDWESAELQGLPALDLLYFLTFLTFSLDEAERGGRCRDSYRATLDPSTLTGAVRRECLARYASRIGLTDAAIGPLRLLVWLLHSRSEYRRLVADTGGRPGRELLRRSLFVGLWEEELRNMTRRRLH